MNITSPPAASELNDITDYAALWDVAMSGSIDAWARIDLYAELDRLQQAITPNFSGYAHGEEVAARFVQVLHREDQEMYVAPLQDLLALWRFFYEELPVNVQRLLLSQWKPQRARPGHNEIIRTFHLGQRMRGLLVQPDFPPKSGTVQTLFDYCFTEDTAGIRIFIAEGMTKAEAMRQLEAAINHLRAYWHEAIAHSPENFVVKSHVGV